MPSAKTNHEIECTKVKQLFQSGFVNEHDHEAVQLAMENMPTMALFMKTSRDDSGKQARQATLEKATTETDNFYCLAAVNYF
jgi:hypothetical protein